jgi:hypothetical protein
MRINVRAESILYNCQLLGLLIDDVIGFLAEVDKIVSQNVFQAIHMVIMAKDRALVAY